MNCVAMFIPFNGRLALGEQLQICTGTTVQMKRKGSGKRPPQAKDFIFYHLKLKPVINPVKSAQRK
jgi:hypothetical protein